MNEIIRYLVKIEVFATKDGETVTIKEKEYETEGNNLFQLPTFRMFANEVTFSMTVKLLKKRFYKKSHSNAGMIELEREEDI